MHIMMTEEVAIENQYGEQQSSFTNSQQSSNSIYRCNLNVSLLNFLRSQAFRACQRYFQRLSSSESSPLQQGRMGTPLDIWQRQENGELSTRITWDRSLPKILKSLAQILLFNLMQCSRQRRCWMSQNSGSIQLRMVSAYDLSLAVNAIISQCFRILLRKLMAQGLMDTYPFSFVSSKERVISRSQGWFLSQEQWNRVSSKSITRVFFPTFSFKIGTSTLTCGATLGRVSDMQDFRISSDIVKCSNALQLMPAIPFTTQARQYVLIFCAHMILSLLWTALISFFWLSRLMVLSQSFSSMESSIHFPLPEEDYLKLFNSKLAELSSLGTSTVNCFLASASFSCRFWKVESKVLEVLEGTVFDEAIYLPCGYFLPKRSSTPILEMSLERKVRGVSYFGQHESLTRSIFQTGMENLKFYQICSSAWFLLWVFILEDIQIQQSHFWEQIQSAFQSCESDGEEKDQEYI